MKMLGDYMIDYLILWEVWYGSRCTKLAWWLYLLINCAIIQMHKGKEFTETEQKKINATQKKN